tara:strand:- start:628 stop:882 length:255 start_codon:yes stop_codon:yes gene_type:complete
MPKPQKLLSLESVVGASLLTFFTWVTLSLFSVSTAVAVIEAEQVIDKKVNEDVKEMRDILIRTDSNVAHLRENMKDLLELNRGI